MARGVGGQTLLESLKATFAGIQPRPPHQIAPTVGLNSKAPHTHATQDTRPHPDPRTTHTHDPTPTQTHDPYTKPCLGGWPCAPYIHGACPLARLPRPLSFSPSSSSSSSSSSCSSTRRTQSVGSR